MDATKSAGAAGRKTKLDHNLDRAKQELAKREEVLAEWEREHSAHLGALEQQKVVTGEALTRATRDYWNAVNDVLEARGIGQVRWGVLSPTLRWSDAFAVAVLESLGLTAEDVRHRHRGNPQHRGSDRLAEACDYALNRVIAHLVQSDADLRALNTERLRLDDELTRIRTEIRNAEAPKRTLQDQVYRARSEVWTAEQKIADRDAKRAVPAAPTPIEEVRDTERGRLVRTKLDALGELLTKAGGDTEERKIAIELIVARMGSKR